MLSEKDLENFGYYEMFQSESSPTNAFALYGKWVEGKILTEGAERVQENWSGLIAEVGEANAKLQKAARGDRVLDLEGLYKEFGDVLFYLTALTNLYGSTLDKIAELNMEKLDKRQKEGTIRGDGDNR
jgi:NTP pyrophosphatase (non-canonical NTP hydrolase)